jgi:tetratricopeptide (TPR) repeat protein
MKARPDDWASHANLGNFYMERREFDQAVRCFETSYKLEPRMIEPMVNAAMAYSNSKRNDRAETCLRRALKVQPTNAAANFNLGLLLAELGRLGEAEKALLTAWQSDPQLAAAAYNLGVIRSASSLDEAILWCQRAFDSRPDEPKYAHSLAFYQHRNGDTDTAVHVLRTAIKRHPLQIDLYLLLTDIYESRGDRKAAANVVRNALGQSGFPSQVRRQLQVKLLSLDPSSADASMPPRSE